MNSKVQFTANLLNTARLVAGNLSDDPGYFVLQIVRKFRKLRLQRFVLALLTPLMGIITVRAFSALLREDRAAMREVCETWLAKADRRSAQAATLANFCVATSQWDLASAIIDNAKTDRSIERVKARLEWALGNMNQAIGILSSRRETRQLIHYRSELSVFSGFRPSLAPAPLGQLSGASSHCVVFLATNSLPHTGSGYAQRTHSMLLALKDHGWEPVAATRVNYPMSIGNLLAPLLDRIGPIEYERLLPFPAKHDKAGLIQQQADELLKKVQRDRPAILHTTTDFTNGLAVNAVAKATGIPWVYEVRGQLADTWLTTRPDSAADSERYRMFVEREAFVAKSADFVVTLGEQMKTNLVSVGVDAEKILVLPNGVGEQFLEEPRAQSEIRSELGLEQDALYVGTVSSLVPYEGLDTVLRAVALIYQTQPKLRVLIVGEGTDFENLISLARELKIIEICLFPGRVSREEAYLYHSAMDIFVVPRKNSSVTRSVTPLKPVEALACRVPVLASDLPALREIISDGENGYLVPAEDSHAWAEALQGLLNDGDRRVRMGKFGRENVLRTRTWRNNVEQLVSEYDRAIMKSR